MTTKPRRLRAFTALLTIGVTATAWLAAAPVARADDTAKVLLLLDVSGSMNEKISSGGTKFVAAKRALKQVADGLPAGTQVGLRVYGSEISEPKETNPKACTDTELVLPMGPLDRSKMYRAVNSFEAVGETPIAYSLEKSVDDLGKKGRRVLVLISDGEESCAGDPCPAARKLAGTGVDLQFNAIGLDVSGKARRQLKCIADAGDGSYYDADQADDLSEALRKITQRALRPFPITGTPVTGSEDPGSAPNLAVGQYRDRFAVDEAKKFYGVPRSPRQTVTASVNSLVPPTGDYNLERWNLELTTAGGEKCDALGYDNGTYDTTLVVSGAVVSGDQIAGCRTEPLLLSVQRISRASNDKPAPAEIVIGNEPEITNTAALPGPVTSSEEKGRPVNEAESARRTVGGTSFTNAPTLTPGSYTDAPAVGESVFFRVRLETGQQLRATLKAPIRPGGFDLSSWETVTPALLVYSPSRVPMTQQIGFLQGNSRVAVTASAPQVRVRNREMVHDTYLTTDRGRDNAFYAAEAGDYYLSVQVRKTSALTGGRVLPIRLNIAVDGEPAGQPAYATAPPSGSPSASAESTADPSASGVPGVPPSDTGPGMVALGIAAAGGAALAAAVAVTAVLLVRRSRSSRTTPVHDR